MSSNTNRAAWLPTPKARPLQIDSSPLNHLDAIQILIKTHAAAIQLIDGLLQLHAFVPLHYPAILGVDVAGEVIEIRSAVSRLKVGDRVIGTASGVLNGKSEEGRNTWYLGRMWQEPFLGLTLPTVPARDYTGETVLIWGGASSVGCNAIQLAVAAGYAVVTTASEKNFGLLKSLGAGVAIEYHSTNAVSDVASALQGRKLAGALDCIGGEATIMTAKAMEYVDGTREVITTKPAKEADVEGVIGHFVDGAEFGESEVAETVYGSFLGEALERGVFVTAPEAVVVGRGLENVEEGVDLVMKRMSARKAAVVL